MARIFVCYRREDSPGHTGRLYDHLISYFGQETVFRDIEAIEPGADFVQAVEAAIGSSDVLLAVIGPQWLDARDKQGRRRLENPKDFVRLELATALARGLRVVPVLVDNASMPAEEELPPDLAPLARRNALELSDSRFPSDVEHLAHALEAALGRRPEQQARVPLQPAPPAAVDKRGRHTSRWLLLMGGAVLAMALLLLTTRLRPSEVPSRQEDAGTTRPEDAGQPPEKKPAETPLRKFSAGEGFTVMVPGEPVVKRATLTVPQFGEVPTASWTSAVDGVTYTFGFAYFKGGAATPSEVKRIFESGEQGLIQLYKGTLESEKDITLQGYPGKSFRIIAEDKKVVEGRSYMVGTRRYTLYVVYEPSIGAPHSDKFLSSFTLVTPLPPGSPGSRDRARQRNLNPPARPE